MELLWWHWIVLALVLVGIEMLTPTFFLMWFGLGALLTGLLVTFVPLGFAAQLLIWAVTSLIMTFVWLKYFKNPDRTRVGQAKEGVLGSTGLVSKAITDLGQGEILFQRPVLGADRWPAIADAPIPAGVKARVVDVLGQTLKIEQL
ncbi:MAG TPA: NfeD family protein [Thiobacillaceae bacterium]|nr:NfeD family protein [Thiobacillaceae bacterium]